MADLVHRELGIDLGVRVVQHLSIRRGRVEPDVIADDVRTADVQVQELADVEYRTTDRHPVARVRGVVLRQIRYLEAGALLRVAQIGGEDVLAQTSVGHQLAEEFAAIAGHDVGQRLAYGDGEPCAAAHVDECAAAAVVGGPQQFPERVRLGADHVVHPAPLPGLDDVAPAVESDRGIGAGERDGELQPACGRRRVQVRALDELLRRPDPQIEPVLAGPGARGNEPQERGDPGTGREHDDGPRRIGRQPEPGRGDDLQRQPVLAIDARPAQEMRCRALPFPRVRPRRLGGGVAEASDHELQRGGGLAGRRRRGDRIQPEWLGRNHRAERVVLAWIGLPQPGDVISARVQQVQDVPQLPLVLHAGVHHPLPRAHGRQFHQPFRHLPSDRPEAGEAQQRPQRQHVDLAVAFPAGHRRSPRRGEPHQLVAGRLQGGDGAAHQLVVVLGQHADPVTGQVVHALPGDVDLQIAGPGARLRGDDAAPAGGAEHHRRTHRRAALLADDGQLAVHLVPGPVLEQSGEPGAGRHLPADLERHLQEAVRLDAVQAHPAAVAYVGVEHGVVDAAQGGVAGVLDVLAHRHLAQRGHQLLPVPGEESGEVDALLPDQRAIVPALEKRVQRVDLRLRGAARAGCTVEDRDACGADRFGPQHLVERMPAAQVGIDLRVNGLGYVLQPVEDHQQRALQGDRIVGDDGLLSVQHGAKHGREAHRELGGDQVEHSLRRVVPGRHEQVHVVQRPRSGRIAQPPVVEEQIDVGDGRDLLAQAARDRGPRSQQRLGQSGRRVDRHVLIGVGEHAEQGRGAQQVPVGQRLGPGVEHRHRIERPAQRQPTEQLGQPVGHVVPGPVRFREGQQRRLGRQKSVRERQESVEFVPDLPVVRLGGLHHAPCGDALTAQPAAPRSASSD